MILYLCVDEQVTSAMRTNRHSLSASIATDAIVRVAFTRMKIEDKHETIGATLEHDDFVFFMTSTDELQDQRERRMRERESPSAPKPFTVFVAESHLNCSSKPFIA